jgi:protein tyrosine phosphatase
MVSYFTGPRGKQVAAFWHMVWQENVHVVVMATGLFENAAVSFCSYNKTNSKNFTL